MSWLDVWEITHAIRIVRPFSGAGRREIVAQPKVYGFDAGFVCHARGWDRLRPEDCGSLWEHVVLESLVAGGLPRICSWRDKQQREVDFLVPRARGFVDAIECQWHVSEFATRGLSAFREGYPKGRNFLVVPGTAAPTSGASATSRSPCSRPMPCGRTSRGREPGRARSPLSCRPRGAARC